LDQQLSDPELEKKQLTLP
jgi:hypothetical protein